MRVQVLRFDSILAPAPAVSRGGPDRIAAGGDPAVAPVRGRPAWNRRLARALAPVLALPPGERTAVQGQRLSAVRAELARPVYRGSAQARELDEKIEEFGCDTIVGVLSALPG